MNAQSDMPFSFPVNVRSLPGKGRRVTYEADEAVLEKLAQENGLLALKSFSATAHLSPWQKGGASVSGSVKADMVQPCAVSGEPLEARVSETFDRVFVPQNSRLAKPRVDRDGEWIIDPEGDDSPDTFIGDSIDLAWPWLETLVLGIDPFARTPGAQLQFDDPHDGDESPFAALAGLKTH